MSTNMPPYPPPPGVPMYPPPAKKKVSPIVWVLAGIGGFLILVFIVVVGAGFFLMHKAKQSGFDAGLMRKNPAYATVKIMAALNPNIEVISMDDDRGVVTVRDKKEGKTFTVNLEDAKKGRFVFKEDGKEAVTMNTTGDGKSGGIEIKSQDGTFKLGGGQGAKVPTWIPDYPGSDPQSAYSAQSKDGDSGSYQFKTSDAADKVTRFYEDGLKSSGFRVSTVSGTGAGSSGGMITGDDTDKKHTAVVMVGADSGSTTVSVTYTMKK